MKQRKARRDLFRKYFVALFPSPIYYFNFWMVIVFLIFLSFVRELDLFLISVFAIGYFLNQMVKEIYKK